MYRLELETRLLHEICVEELAVLPEALPVRHENDIGVPSHPTGKRNFVLLTRFTVNDTARTYKSKTMNLGLSL